MMRGRTVESAARGTGWTMQEQHGAADTGRPDEDAPAQDETVTVAQDEAVTVDGVDAAQHAAELLAEHVPLALLVDLLAPTGETSSALAASEGLPEQHWWEGEEGTGTARA